MKSLIAEIDYIIPAGVDVIYQKIPETEVDVVLRKAEKYLPEIFL